MKTRAFFWMVNSGTESTRCGVGTKRESPHSGFEALEFPEALSYYSNSRVQRPPLYSTESIE